MMICSSTNWESSFLTWKICTKSMPLARRNTKLGNSVCGPQTGLLAEPTWLRSRVWCSGLWALSWCNFWGWCRLEERQSVSQYENTEAPQIKQNSLNSRTTCFNLRIYCNYRNHTLLYLDPVDFSFFWNWENTQISLGEISIQWVSIFFKIPNKYVYWFSFGFPLSDVPIKKETLYSQLLCGSHHRSPPVSTDKSFPVVRINVLINAQNPLENVNESNWVFSEKFWWGLDSAIGKRDKTLVQLHWNLVMDLASNRMWSQAFHSTMFPLLGLIHYKMLLDLQILGFVWHLSHPSLVLNIFHLTKLRCMLLMFLISRCFQPHLNTDYKPPAEIQYGDAHAQEWRGLHRVSVVSRCFTIYSVLINMSHHWVPFELNVSPLKTMIKPKNNNFIIRIQAKGLFEHDSIVLRVWFKL